MPSIYMMDVENDDYGLLLILEKQHAKNETLMCVIVQLPEGEEYSTVEEFYKNKGYEVFRDPQAKNGKAILKTFAIYGPQQN